MLACLLYFFFVLLGFGAFLPKKKTISPSILDYYPKIWYFVLGCLYKQDLFLFLFFFLPFNFINVRGLYELAASYRCAYQKILNYHEDMVVDGEINLL